MKLFKYLLFGLLISIPIVVFCQPTNPLAAPITTVTNSFSLNPAAIQDLINFAHDSNLGKIIVGLGGLGSLYAALVAFYRANQKFIPDQFKNGIIAKYLNTFGHCILIDNPNNDTTSHIIQNPPPTVAQININPSHLPLAK